MLEKKEENMSRLKDRTGETNIAKCGLKMTIIVYRNGDDIDVQFENGIIVKHRNYCNFRKGKIAPISKKEKGKLHIGEKRMANCGMEMEIIAYRSNKDIDVRFSDGGIVKHRAYSEFFRGGISQDELKRLNRLGEKRMANCGMEMEIIAYRKSTDIDVKFANGQIIQHRSYKEFDLGTISPISAKMQGKLRIGEKRVATCGMEMEIIAYRNASDIDVLFSDGAVVEHQSYNYFQKGMIKPPLSSRATKYIGEKSIATCGMEMEIIAYRKASDIDVRFSDGTVVEHRSYSSFQQGVIKHPLIAATKYIGEEAVTTCGLKAKIVGYTNSKDLTVQFEDGEIAEHRDHTSFLEGCIAHPAFGRRSKGVFYGVLAVRAVTDGDNVYYTCTFPDGTKDICTPQEIMARQGIKPVF